VTILIIQGPQPTARSLGGDLLAGLRQLAQSAGQTLELCTCSSLRDFVTRLRAARPSSTQFMLLDPGDINRQIHTYQDNELGDTLEALGTPYIEMQDDSEAALETVPASGHAPLATIVTNGDLGTSYRIALGIAIRQLPKP
jgi:3-dehydroquinate dehydratase II